MCTIVFFKPYLFVQDGEARVNDAKVQADQLVPMRCDDGLDGVQPRDFFWMAQGAFIKRLEEGIRRTDFAEGYWADGDFVMTCQRSRVQETLLKVGGWAEKGRVSVSLQPQCLAEQRRAFEVLIAVYPGDGPYRTRGT